MRPPPTGQRCRAVGRAARYRRPQRRGAGDRHQDRLAVRRAAPHRRRRRGIEKLLDRVLPDIDVERDLRDKLSSERGFVWLKRELTPKQQAEIIAARPSRHRLPHREAPLLSRRPDRLAHRRPHQHRQPGHRRHREIHRRPGSCRPAACGSGHRQGLKPVRLSIDLRVQHIVRDELRKAHGALPGHRRRRPSCSTSRPARWWRWCRCRTTIPNNARRCAR